jgi:acyl carrier protein phosphodiesterase
MNFVGHAHVARALTGSPAIVLGAMLPDFASMGRVRLGAIEHPEVAAGIALHHRTDDAFHGGEAFVRLCARTSTDLESRGLPWGASRAIAHVGTELLLDGFLLDDRDTTDAYLAAIELLADRATTSALATTGPRAPHFSDLCERVRRHGLPAAYRDPAQVADRLIVILAPRPRLAIDPSHRATLVRALEALQEEVRRERDSLVVPTRSIVLDSPLPK